MLQSRLILHVVAVLGRYADINLGHLESLRMRQSQLQQSLGTVDTVADQALFVEFNRRPFTLPPLIEFEACPDFYDVVRMLQ